MGSSVGRPIVGGVYRIETSLLSGRDPKPKRPAVVLALPAFGLTHVPVLMRTTDTHEVGVLHPASRSLGLTREGVFAFRFLRSLDQKWFNVPEAVEFLGMLEPAYFGKIQAWWEER